MIFFLVQLFLMFLLIFILLLQTKTNYHYPLLVTIKLLLQVQVELLKLVLVLLKVPFHLQSNQTLNLQKIHVIIYPLHHLLLLQTNYRLLFYPMIFIIKLVLLFFLILMVLPLPLEVIHPLL